VGPPSQLSMTGDACVLVIHQQSATGRRNGDLHGAEARLSGLRADAAPLTRGSHN